MQDMKVDYWRYPIVLPAATINKAVNIEKLFWEAGHKVIHAADVGKNGKMQTAKKALPSYPENLLQEATETRKKTSQ